MLALARRRMPFQELLELQRDLMNLFGRSFGRAITEAADFLTNTEAYFKDGHLVIRAELAGVDPKSVDVSVVGRTLTIKGERAQGAGGSDGQPALRRDRLRDVRADRDGA